ncbi:MAG: hypothetical protein ABIB71_01070 [Candidatus Woesearchaeota archaeon]
MTKNKEFYLCMECAKLYDENPIECKDDDGKVHSRFSSDYGCTHTGCKDGTYRRSSDISDWIFKFEYGADESLKNIPDFTGQTPKYDLEKNGFETIARFSHMNGRIYKDKIKKTKEEVKGLVSLLNEQKREYILFSTSQFPGITYYTFMEKKGGC